MVARAGRSQWDRRSGEADLDARHDDPTNGRKQTTIERVGRPIVADGGARSCQNREPCAPSAGDAGSVSAPTATATASNGDAVRGPVSRTTNSQNPIGRRSDGIDKQATNARALVS